MEVGPGWEDALRAWRRITRRVGSAGTEGAVETLGDLTVVRRQLEHLELAAVRAARREGVPWAEIATALGMSRQSAWERWRELDDVPAAVAEPQPRGGRRSRRGGVSGTVVDVPDVIGLSCTDARSVIIEVGLVPLLHIPGGEATIFPSEAAGVITDQVPKVGARRRFGSSLVLWYDEGGEAGVREPRRPAPKAPAARAEIAEGERPGDYVLFARSAPLRSA